MERTNHRSEAPRTEPGLITQSEARIEATRLRSEGRYAIATTYPYSCWGGQEQGWTVLEYPDLQTMRRDFGLGR